MRLIYKRKILADAAKYDASRSSSGGKKRNSEATRDTGSNEGTGICRSYTPDGRRVSLLKIPLTSQCLSDRACGINRRFSSIARAEAGEYARFVGERGEARALAAGRMAQEGQDRGS